MDIKDQPAADNKQPAVALAYCRLATLEESLSWLRFAVRQLLAATQHRISAKDSLLRKSIMPLLAACCLLLTASYRVAVSIEG